MRTPRPHVMTRDQLNHLLDAFATDTLTPEERNQLNGAARRDERLLCALADAQALQEVLEDPALRRRLLLELTDGGSWRVRWTHPWVWTAAGGSMIAIAVIIATQLYPEHGRERSAGVGEEIEFTPLAATPAPESNPTAPPADETRISLTRPLDSDLPAAPVMKRRAAPLAKPLEEERVFDDGVKAAAVPQKSAHEGAAKKSRDMASAPRRDPRDELESVSDALMTGQDGTMPATLAEPAEPPQAHATTPAPARRTTPEQVPTARTVFYDAPRLATATALRPRDQVISGPAPLAVRYSLMIAGPQGTYREVDLETPVTVSDRPRLAVQTNQDGYLLVTEVPSTPEITIAPTVSPRPVRARTTTIFPLGGLMTNSTANPALGVRVLFAHRPPNPKLLLTQLPRPPLEERVEPALGGPTEHAVYATAPADSATSILLVDVPLNPWPETSLSVVSTPDVAGDATQP